MYKFKRFTKTHSKTDDRISITRSYTIGMPGQFVRQNLDSKPRYMVLFFDMEKSAMGIRFTNDDTEEGKFSVIYSKVGYGATVIARSFFRINNINIDTVRGKYVWKKQHIDGIGELFVIEFKSSAVVTESRVEEVDNELGQDKTKM